MSKAQWKHCKACNRNLFTARDICFHCLGPLDPYDEEVVNA